VREKLSQALYLPVILFGFAYLTAPYHKILPEALAPVFLQGPYWALAAIFALAVIFNRPKIAQISILVASLFYLQASTELKPLWHLSLDILIPLNIAVISLYQERPLGGLISLTRFAFIIAQLSSIYYLLNLLPASELQAIVQILEHPLIVSADKWPSYFQFSQTALLTSAFAALVIAAITFFRSNPITQSIFAASIGAYLILFFNFESNVDSALLIATTILLGHGLFRDYYDMAYKDELTGLPQRRALNEHLASLGNKYTLAMLDVDFFKKFNDTHGHDIGDQVLQMVAGQIRKVQGGGKAYRYGGEEFTVVFPNKNAEHAAYNLELVRKSIEEYNMVVREKERIEDTDKKPKRSRKKGSFREASKTVSVTISIGVAEKRHRSEKPDDVLKRSDTALYKAKDTGRNKVQTD